MRHEDDVDAPAALPLTESLETPANAPAGRADIATFQKLQERTLRNRTRLLDRFHQLPLYGKGRAKCDGPKARWTKEGCPSDHPLIQMILDLRNEEETLAGMEATLKEEGVEWRDWYKLKLAVKTKIADLLLSLQKENDKVYDELMSVLEHDQRITQHQDKMAIASKRGDDELSDADLLAKAKRLNIPLNGDA